MSGGNGTFGGSRGPCRRHSLLLPISDAIHERPQLFYLALGPPRVESSNGLPTADQTDTKNMIITAFIH